MDFSNTFKCGTRGFKKKKKPVAAAEDNIIKDENNQDLEDANFGLPSSSSQTEIEIPRNLTIT